MADGAFSQSFLTERRPSLMDFTGFSEGGGLPAAIWEQVLETCTSVGLEARNSRSGGHKVSVSLCEPAERLNVFMSRLVLCQPVVTSGSFLGLSPLFNLPYRVFWTQPRRQTGSECFS